MLGAGLLDELGDELATSVVDVLVRHLGVLQAVVRRCLAYGNRQAQFLY